MQSRRLYFFYEVQFLNASGPVGALDQRRRSSLGLLGLLWTCFGSALGLSGLHVQLSPFRTESPSMMIEFA